MGAASGRAVVMEQAGRRPPDSAAAFGADMEAGTRLPGTQVPGYSDVAPSGRVGSRTSAPFRTVPSGTIEGSPMVSTWGSPRAVGIACEGHCPREAYTNRWRGLLAFRADARLKQRHEEKQNEEEMP